jgi:DNA-binding MltR family transcriptional regulator
MTKKKEWAVLGDYIALIRESKDESDRGMSLILAAWLDDALDQYLRTRMVNDVKVVESLFGPDRPLGTFSAKINATYGFAYISMDVFRDLNTIREIRNLFAHDRGTISFATQSIADKCKTFHVLRKHNATEKYPELRVTGGRDEFLVTSLMYTAYFIIRSEEWQHQEFRATEEEKMLIHNVIPRLMKSLQPDKEKP